MGRVEADLLVGCDGIHSVVRRAFYPDEGPPKWNGITMWRGVTEGTPFLSGRTMIMAGHSGRRMVVYPISERHEERGQALINWVAEFKTADGRPMPAQDWEHTARHEDGSPRLPRSFRLPRRAGADPRRRGIYQYPMVDRDPLPTWDFGRVTLLGDAAHPMYPVGANGASQAILDARVLARELALQPSVEAAVAAYDAQRRPATAAVVLANRAGGPERRLDLVEERAPDGFANLDDVISREEFEEIAQLQAHGRLRSRDPQQPALAVGPRRERPPSPDRHRATRVMGPSRVCGGGRVTWREAPREGSTSG